MRATAPLSRRVPGRQEMRWRVAGAFAVYLALLGAVLTLIWMLPR